jgi:hypothetical protein
MPVDFDRRLSRKEINRMRGRSLRIPPDSHEDRDPARRVRLARNAVADQDALLMALGEYGFDTSPAEQPSSEVPGISSEELMAEYAVFKERVDVLVADEPERQRWFAEVRARYGDVSFVGRVLQALGRVISR